jgi:HEAT repeat protein
VNVDLRRKVTGLLADLDDPRAENALCALRDLREALPLVAEAYGRESDGQRRESLIHCLWQFRDIAALPTLSVALRDPDDRVWKEALDGIVTLGGDAALGVLEEARDALRKEPETKRQWIEEAIGQIREDNESGQI